MIQAYVTCEYEIIRAMDLSTSTRCYVQKYSVPAPWGGYTPLLPHPSIRRGVGQLNGTDSR